MSRDTGRAATGGGSSFNSGNNLIRPNPGSVIDWQMAFSEENYSVIIECKSSKEEKKNPK
jgi:hypothetical protein